MNALNRNKNEFDKVVENFQNSEAHNTITKIKVKFNDRLFFRTITHMIIRVMKKIKLII